MVNAGGKCLDRPWGSWLFPKMDAEREAAGALHGSRVPREMMRPTRPEWRGATIELGMRAMTMRRKGSGWRFAGRIKAGRIKPILEVAYLHSKASIIAFVSAGNSHLHHHGKTSSYSGPACCVPGPVQLSHLLPSKRAAFG